MGEHSKHIVALLVLISAPACFVHTIRHDENEAAISALKFAQTAFIASDTDGAYNMLAERSRNYYPKEQIAATIARMNVPTRPKRITAVEYEPVPGQAMLNIFLEGENGDEKFYYRIELIGSAQEGYEVSGFFRGHDKYPPSSLRVPLQARRSVNS